MSAPLSEGSLYINGECVGDVQRRGSSASWSYGEFKPNKSFGEFAQIFGAWSLLMHAESNEEPLSDDAGDELRTIETELDRLQVRLHWKKDNQWVDVAAVNIDGELIEWKAA